MGSGFTINTALKVSKYGIDSVLSLVDDVLMEKLRKLYCKRYNLPYSEITKMHIDYRAERISAYLNLLNNIAEKDFAELKESALISLTAAESYFLLLPDDSTLKKEFLDLRDKNKGDVSRFSEWLQANIVRGSIDVNIMTKLDRPNFKDDKRLPNEYNDAHSAVRGFAKSSLSSSLVLSAGMNPELYGYIAGFSDFFPDTDSNLKKKIVIKVSDYRSAFIQGKFLAKKGLWVSEFRVESGLNCGGHTFATNGLLMGPILEEFRNKKDELKTTIYKIYCQALKETGRNIPFTPLDFKITAQGGIGNSAEHDFLLKYYNVDSVGWGSPFLLVPEVTEVDDYSLKVLKEAGEEDIYLSNISPLQIPFYCLEGNSRDFEKEKRIEEGLPGSKCPRKYLALNKEFSDEGLCLASFEYQFHKIKELDAKNLPAEEYDIEYNNITEKSCICAGLGTSVLMKNGIDISDEEPGASLCPSPTVAWFNKEYSLKEMIDHIYGRTNLILSDKRPNVFIKELSININFIKNLIIESKNTCTKKQLKEHIAFTENLNDGISYYKALFTKNNYLFGHEILSVETALREARLMLNEIKEEVHLSEIA